jgi:hypothetical protein
MLFGIYFPIPIPSKALIYIIFNINKKVLDLNKQKNAKRL